MKKLALMTEPFAHTSGPRSAKIVFVGEAWGESEAEYGRPFVGYSGQEFWRLLGEAWPQVAPKAHALAASAIPQYKDRPLSPWISLREQWLEEASVLFTNVFALHPPSNSLEAFCVKKAELGPGYHLPPLSKGLYLRPDYLGEVDRLYHELDEVRPNLVVALGNTAIWALLRRTDIGSIRGAVTAGVWPRKSSRSNGDYQGLKVLPTYHPAAVLRQWSWRPIVLIDLMKALRESAFPEIRRPRREITVNPDLVELRRWHQEVFPNARILSVDIETGAGQIKCIGFATAKDRAIVIPFVDLSHPSGSYWSTQSYEIEAWKIVKDVLASPVPKLFQNGVYDIQYLARMGFKVMNSLHDTMLLHHSLYPEMQKGLGFLGSIYSDEASWKLMRRQKQDSEKRDE